MRKVLIVDDELLARRMLKESIVWEEYGYSSCGEAANGKDGLEKAVQLRPDLIFVDIKMPVMSGLTMVREIQALELGCEIVMLTCYEDFDYVREAMRCGAADYLLKHTFEDEDLKELLRRIEKRIQKEENRMESLNLLKENVFEKMEETILKAKENLDSVGGKVECVALHVPAGIGEPFFDSLESHLSSLMFSIPAVKSVSFGDGEMIDQMLGSEANDCYYYDENGNVKTSSNHNGGITGGITNGMPVSCTVTFKPTPSIGKKQKTINVETKENVELEIKGRHDPCIVQRAVVVVEAMMALGILDMMGE